LVPRRDLDILGAANHAARLFGAGHRPTRLTPGATAISGRGNAMLTIADTRHAHHCQGYTRREFLRIGGLGLLGGLTLPDLLRARAAAASAGSVVKDRSVVLLFLQGGPSHIEFFDPKMSAPADVRSMTGEVQTGWPGVTFA